MSNPIIINIENCNNIDKGKIEIIPKYLNIKYGINGTGKSTIANSIRYCIADSKNDENTLSNLKSFKNYNNDIEPKVEIEGDINEILIFNDEYIEKHIFLENDLIENSFEILICDEIYEKNRRNINIYIDELKKFFHNNKILDDMIQSLEALNKAFGTSKNISKASTFFKALGKGNNINPENIPEELKPYSDFIISKDNNNWAKWHLDGGKFVDVSDNCPFCSIEFDDKKEIIKKLSETYDHNNLKHLNNIIEMIKELDQYFVENTYKELLEICNSSDGLDDTEINYLTEVKNQINTLLNKLYFLRTIDFHSLKDIQKKEELKIQLDKYIVNLEHLSHLKSSSNSQQINILNSKIKDIQEQTNKIYGQIQKQNHHIKKLIKENNDKINYFLEHAGYNYSVNIEEDNDKKDYKLRLVHNDLPDEYIEDTKGHLSFGEKNAFALILFMLEAVSKDPDLIILDDPISSFDEHKKYAIIDMLFRDKDSLKNKTVLLLTHDFEPIIDIVHTFHKESHQHTKATFLENNFGELAEKDIKKENVESFIQIAESNIANLEDDKTELSKENKVRKLVYLRRLYEIHGNKDREYNVLSSLFKRRDYANYSDDEKMSDEDLLYCEEKIQEYIENFTYSSVLDIFNNTDFMLNLYKELENNYEKLQVYRIININNSQDNIVKKFVNETYHIENDYLYQLNPCRYQVVPSYIIEQCNSELKNNFDLAKITE